MTAKIENPARARKAAQAAYATPDGRPYYVQPGYRSAVAHPFHVSCYRDWSAAAPVTVGFQTEAEARRFASMRPEPIIDLVKRDAGIIARRRMATHPHPCRPIAAYYGDDFPDTRSEATE
jgi:hypothetical protein